jgi:hypothetical protein
MVLLSGNAVAQVDPSGNWRTLHTQHFRIHFRPAYRAIAIDAAAEAERAYALLATELHPPRGIVDLTLGDDVDAPNGFATTYPSNRFTILLVPPVSDPALQNFDSWRRLVIVHELAHVFHLDRSRGVWKTVQSVFGRAPGLFPNQYQPTWVIEGFATYYESRFTAAGRAEGSFHQQMVGADAAAGTARSPWDALSFTRWPDGNTPYAYGSRFWEYLSRTAGDSVVPRFSEAAAGQLIPFRVGRPLKRVGAPRALTDDWTRAVAAAKPDLTLLPTQSRSRLIAGALRSQPTPRVSPDGRSVAYVFDDGRGARRLRVTDADDGTVRRSHRVTGQVAYDWLGDTLIVAQLDFVDRWRLRSDLWSWMPDGAWHRTTAGARLIEPRAGGGVLTAVAIDAGDNAPVLRSPLSAHLVSGLDPAGTTWGDVVPSPDGRSVVASRHRDGHWALVRWSAAAPAAVTVLAEPPGGVADPTWTRDGAGVLYTSDVAGFPQIHRWTDGGIEQLTAEPVGARTPAMLTDGTLLFTTLAGEGWELRAVAPSPRAAVSLPAPPPFDSAPRVAARETGYASWPSLRPHFWIPLAFNAGDAGFFVGAATGGGDAIGRYAYFANALVAPSPLRAQGSMIVVTNVLGDPTLDLSASNDWSLVGTDSTGHVVSAEHREAALGAMVSARQWRSFVALRVAAEYEGRRYTVSPDTTLADICTGCRHRDLVGGSASLSFGSTVGAPLAVSLQDGVVAGLLYRRREEQGTARWLNEVRGRLALYARIGPRIGFAYPVLALRIAAGAFDGPIPDRLAVGGVSSGTTEIGLGQSVGTTRTFPVRGYRAGALRGRRAATVTAEYRVPLALVGRSLGHLPLGADKLAFAVFGDVGDAWDPGEPARLHRLRSAGIELIGDLTVSYDLPLRVRVGVAQPASGHPRLYAALAADF